MMKIKSSEDNIIEIKSPKLDSRAEEILSKLFLATSEYVTLEDKARTVIALQVLAAFITIASIVFENRVRGSDENELKQINEAVEAAKAILDEAVVLNYNSVKKGMEKASEAEEGEGLIYFADDAFVN